MLLLPDLLAIPSLTTDEIRFLKHEYISLFWLRQSGCDETVYKHTSNVYIPKRCSTRDFCYCGLPKDGDVEKCSFCSQHFQNLVLDCVLQGKTTLEAKEAIQ